MRKNSNEKKILLEHGGGGKAAHDLIQRVFISRFNNPIINALEDAAQLPQLPNANLKGNLKGNLEGNLLMTTDGYTVTPLFFPGGDIGSLAITGTCNDLAVMGGCALYLSASFIIEEGFPLVELERIADSMATTVNTAGVKIVCGDTKVVPRGAADGVFITTTGIGQQILPVSAQQITNGDSVIVSGTLGDHGAVIFSQREGMTLQSTLVSDLQLLWPMVEALDKAKVRVRAMRDMTRGGMAAVLNELCAASGKSMEIEERLLPVHNSVQGICELLGFEPFTLANEGAMIIVVHPDDSERTVEVLRSRPGGAHATRIGTVKTSQSGRIQVQLRSEWGTSRVLEMPQGEILPRIC